MYLLPTGEELANLWNQISPKQRFLRAAKQAINDACRFDDSMAAFYLDSQDVNMVMEDDAMPYFDEIEDDIISMQRDTNGFKLHIPAPRYLEHIPNSGHLNFKGWSYEYVPSKTEFPDGPGVIHASSWDEI